MPPSTGRGRRTIGLFLAIVILAVGFAAAGFAARQATQPDPRSMEAIAAELSAQYEAEHREMSERLVTAATAVHRDLLPLLAEMHAAMPVESGVEAQPATPPQAETWTATTSGSVDRLAEFGLGATSFNGTRGALRGAVQQLDVAARTYGEALRADGQAAHRLTELAAEQRDAAVELWGVAAEQLDELSIGADLGHVHLFLPVTGDVDSVPLEFREPLGVEPDVR